MLQIHKLILECILLSYIFRYKEISDSYNYINLQQDRNYVYFSNFSIIYIIKLIYKNYL